MTFQQLTYVVEISKCGSINKAAHKLFLSQSGISTAVRELEEELGIKFFVRSNRGVEFTPEGKEFLGYAVSLLEQKQRIESLYGESRSTIAPVHFSVSTQRYPFTEDAFLEMLQQNQENRYQYTLKETSMDGVIDDVYDHRADIGVIFLTKLTEKIVCRLLDGRELTFHELAAVPPCVYVRKGHPLTQLEHVSEADLEGYPYSSFEQAQGVAVDFSEELPMVSMRKPSKAIIVNNRSTAMNVQSISPLPMWSPSLWQTRIRYDWAGSIRRTPSSPLTPKNLSAFWNSLFSVLLHIPLPCIVRSSANKHI